MSNDVCYQGMNETEILTMEGLQRRDNDEQSLKAESLTLSLQALWTDVEEKANGTH